MMLTLIPALAICSSILIIKITIPSESNELFSPTIAADSSRAILPSSDNCLFNSSAHLQIISKNSSLFFEKTLENNSIPDLLNSSTSDNLSQQALQKIYDNLDGIVYSLKQTSENQNEINSNLSKLSEQIKNVNNHSAGIDEKLSNFLSTQLNTQSSILQLINKINEQGFLDDSTKKIFEDLNQSIQELKAKNKK